MFLSIVHVPSGNQELLRRLAPNESLDLEAHCRKWADMAGYAIAKPNGHIPRGCGEYFAEIRDSNVATGSCWTSYDFYLEAE